MTKTELNKALAVAVKAARAAGALLRKNHRAVKTINEESQHDIKLELDVRCQKLIEKTLLRAFPDWAILGEEGERADAGAACRWVVDPLDGTVNFTYGIPHCCVSIALQTALGGGQYKTVVGVVYDPFCGELWTAVRGQKARLNGTPVRVSTRSKLEECIVTIGFAKSQETIRRTLPYFNKLVPRIRKARNMGAAALALVYVASGRFDAYLEGSVRLWDIEAGGLILECAGGEFWREPAGREHTFRLVASNGLLRGKLAEIGRFY